MPVRNRPRPLPPLPRPGGARRGFLLAAAVGLLVAAGPARAQPPADAAAEASVEVSLYDWVRRAGTLVRRHLADTRLPVRNGAAQVRVRHGEDPTAPPAFSLTLERGQGGALQARLDGASAVVATAQAPEAPVRVRPSAQGYSLDESPSREAVEGTYEVVLSSPSAL